MTNYEMWAIRRVCLIDPLALERGASCAKPSNLHHYIIVRADIPFGSQLAQSAHAAAESPGPKPEPGCHAYVLHAKNEEHLQEIAVKCVNAGLAYHAVVECPDDEDWPGQWMAIGLAPIESKSLAKKVLSSLPLAK